MLSSLFGTANDRDSMSRERSLKPLRWLLALFVILIFVPRLLAFYTESLWFDSLNYSSIFWFEWRAKITLFVAFFVLTFIILRGAFGLLERAFEPFALGGAVRRFDGELLELNPDLFMRPAAWVISIVWSLIAAATMTARWSLWALFFNQVSSDERDPIFNNTLSFYFFSWPIWETVASWLSTLSVFIFLAAAMWALLAFISRLPRAAQEVARRKAYVATALALAGVLLTWAARLYLARFSLLWKGDDIYNGIGYVAARVTLPSYAVLMGVLLVCALLAVFNALRIRSLKIFVVCCVAPTLISLGAGLVENYVSNFVVKPNQLALETPYIKHNIAATRKAFSLDRIAARDFPADGSVQAIQNATQKANENATRTLDNIRLWDWRALQATLTQTQTLRGYYEFPDVDVDRYVINGQLRQVMIAARELDTSRLPANSQNWVNQRLIYTHGYGLVMNTASEFTPEGRPRFIVSEMPLRSTAPEINITRPEIYYGQQTSGHVYVKTTQAEFNFVQGGKDSYSNYEGEGGIDLGSGLRRWAVAWSLGDITKIPFSKAITKDTRVLLHRQIMDRVSRLAPFLQLDNDPYIVAGNDGKLYWMLDAYTTSLYRPYATHYQVGSEWANYARNSVKIVIDAYNGNTDFYVFEPDDPIIQSWRKIFPALFKDAEKMPADLRSHVRYPETLFRTQTEVYGVYHTDDVSAFFSRNDLWSVARLQDNDAGSAPVMAAPFPQPGVPGSMMPGQGPLPGQPQVPVYPRQSAIGNRNGDGFIEPYFLLTQLPGSSAGEEFLLSVPFTPNGRPLNLSGWLAARSDGENYGQLALYNIAESRNISAPQQILARITQEGELSKLISLWNQQKSSVLWGNLLVIPIGRGLLYVQPIFLQSNSSPLPELRLVVLATQDELFYAPTYEGALKKLLGDEAELPSGNTAAPRPSTTDAGSTPTAPGATRAQLIEKAARDLNDYQRLTAEGKYGEAGRKLESLKKNLETLKRTP
jgi:uncharacterized membrane protein (UPF0182 family)